MPLLDLSDADTSGFDAIPSGTYDAVVYEAKWEETKGGENAKLPKGTPQLSVQFKLTEEPYNNRRVFNRYTLPPKKVNGKPYEHYARLTGMFVRFLTAIGFDESAIKVADFEVPLEDLPGRECRVTVGQREYNGEMQNEVKGVKPVGDAVGSGLI